MKFVVSIPTSIQFGVTLFNASPESVCEEVKHCVIPFLPGAGITMLSTQR
jgi:hypothetical protein